MRRCSIWLIQPWNILFLLLLEVDYSRATQSRQSMNFTTRRSFPWDGGFINSGRIQKIRSKNARQSKN